MAGCVTTRNSRIYAYKNYDITMFVSWKIKKFLVITQSAVPMSFSLGHMKNLRMLCKVYRNGF